MVLGIQALKHTGMSNPRNKGAQGAHGLCSYGRQVEFCAPTLPIYSLLFSASGVVAVPALVQELRSP